MKPFVVASALAALVLPASAQDMSSEYTKLDQNEDCLVTARAGEGDGDWADLVCPGYGGYPYVIRYGDGRETVTYGFATQSGMNSFAPFNYSNGTVEWLVRAEGDAKRPVAAIQRWFLANGDGAWETQILVVSKVGQPEEGSQACVVGYVAAADGASANERARELAGRAEEFDCDSDAVAIEDAIAEFVPPAE
jgi:hypothetical protein